MGTPHHPGRVGHRGARQGETHNVAKKPTPSMQLEHRASFGFLTDGGYLAVFEHLSKCCLTELDTIHSGT